MLDLFRRFRRPAAPAAPPVSEDVWDRSAQNLIDQGLDPEKVHRATELVKRWSRAGVLPEAYLPPEKE